MAPLFSPNNPAGKIAYTVGHGDSLVKIAAKHKANAELIYRANNLETINLRVGQHLLVPQLSVRITVDRKLNALLLYNQGELFKEYRLMSVKTPGLSSAKPLETKVGDKIALQGSNRVAFGDKNYPGADRWIMLATSGIAIRALPEGAAPPPGILVAPADLEEIFLLVSRGTPVTIN